MPGPFDKDFGYLLPFPDKVAQAADSLSNPAEAKELRDLVSGEKARWARIRELLDSTAKAPGQASRPSPAGAASAQPPDRPAPPQFTVGRLKGLPR